MYCLTGLGSPCELYLPLHTQKKTTKREYVNVFMMSLTLIITNKNTTPTFSVIMYHLQTQKKGQQ
jgi:hypothetical protein